MILIDRESKTEEFWYIKHGLIIFSSKDIEGESFHDDVIVRVSIESESAH